jgi:hypothetical protein
MPPYLSVSCPPVTNNFSFSYSSTDSRPVIADGMIRYIPFMKPFIVLMAFLYSLDDTVHDSIARLMGTDRICHKVHLAIWDTGIR